jgi:hypothetical protein
MWASVRLLRCELGGLAVTLGLPLGLTVDDHPPLGTQHPNHRGANHLICT